MTGSAPILFAYLASALFFILGLKQMSHPRTAVRGIVIAAIGMLIAIVVTLLDPNVSGYVFIVVGLIVGGGIGAFLALKVEMTSMPQMVGLLNGLGGGASTLVAWADLQLGTGHPVDSLIAIGISGLIGTVTFWGSLVAYAKLEEIQQFKKPFSFPNQPLINGALLLVGLVVIGLLATTHSELG